MRLAGKSIVITGATGIAAAAVRKSTAEGARVFVVSIGEEETQALANVIGVVGVATADLSDEEQAGEALQEARTVLGGIDGLFAVAGGSGRRHGDGPADTVSLPAWEATMAANAVPMFLSAREAFRHMAGRGGSVVIVSSVLATSPSPALFATHAYAAAKGAAEAFTRASAAYYAPEGIRVNAIAPGLVDTPMASRAAGDPEIVAYAVRKQPLAGGLLRPEAVADAAIFLLSDESSQITGQVLAVDGGWGVTGV